MHSQPFATLPVGHWFRLPGYDDLLFKSDSSTAKNFGCGLLRKPTRFGRKGSKTEIADDVMVTPV